MKITNETKQTVISDQAEMADSFLSRMTGLLNRTAFSGTGALVITRCNSIHMFFMRFAIDAVFVSKDNVVVGCAKNIKPFRLSRIYFKASYVIELPAGRIDQTQIQIGDRIRLNGRA